MVDAEVCRVAATNLDDSGAKQSENSKACQRMIRCAEGSRPRRPISSAEATMTLHAPSLSMFVVSLVLAVLAIIGGSGGRPSMGARFVM